VGKSSFYAAISLKISGFGAHIMKKCAGGSFYAAGHYKAEQGRFIGVSAECRKATWYPSFGGRAVMPAKVGAEGRDFVE
jgi:hypothetical protein